MIQCLYSQNEKKYNNIKPQIMKKFISTFGLTTLVVLLTSFTTPETTNTIVDNNISIEVIYGGGIASTKKLD